MKKRRLILLAIVVVLFLGIGTVSAQEKKSETVIMTVMGETKGSELYLTLIVINPDGSDYEVSMEKRSDKNRKEVRITNTKIIQSEINKWKQKGYKIDEFEIDNSGEVRYIVMSKD